MRARGLAAVVWLAAAHAAAVEPTALQFVRNGAAVRTIDLAALKASCAVQTVSLDDPYYQRRKQFVACPLGEVLRLGFGESSAQLADEAFVLRARDGYAKPASGARLVEPGGYLAFADA